MHWFSINNLVIWTSKIPGEIWIRGMSGERWSSMGSRQLYWNWCHLFTSMKETRACSSPPLFRLCRGLPVLFPSSLVPCLFILCSWHNGKKQQAHRNYFPLSANWGSSPWQLYKRNEWFAKKSTEDPDLLNSSVILLQWGLIHSDVPLSSTAQLADCFGCES